MTIPSQGATLSPWSVTQIHNELRAIGRQVNHLVVRYEWDNEIMPALRAITKAVSGIRGVLQR